jgi:hypothetical protein
MCIILLLGLYPRTLNDSVSSTLEVRMRPELRVGKVKQLTDVRCTLFESGSVDIELIAVTDMSLCTRV